MTIEMNKKRDLFTRLGAKPKKALEPSVATPVVAQNLEIEPLQNSLPLNNQEIYMSVPEVAKYFEVADATVYRWIYKGELNGTVIGRKRKVASSEVHRFNATYKQPGIKLK